MLFGPRRVYFSLLLLVKSAKLLAHDWSSGYLATGYAIKKCFSVTMMSHFEIVDEEYIKEVKDKSKNENEYWKKVFKKWANERKFPVNLE